MHAPPAPTPAALSGGAAFALLAVASLTIMVGCVIVPGLPGIAQGLGVPRAAGWLVTLPSLGVVLFGTWAGRLIDRWGARRALCGGLVLYAALGLSGAALRGVVPVFADRLLLGGATALVMAGGTALISDFYTGAARLAMIARQGMAIELGGVLFLALGGALTRWGWAAPFALYGVALLFLVLVQLTVPRRRGQPTAEDARRDTQAPGALRPVLLAATCAMVVFFAAVIALPFRLSDASAGALAMTDTQVGYFLSFVSLVAVVAAGLMPAVAKRAGAAATLAIAFGLYASAHLCFAIGLGLPAFLAGAVCLGTGFGLSIPLVNHMTLERSAANVRGRNLTRLSMAIFLGQFLASPLGLLTGTARSAFAVAGVIALVAALVGLAGLVRAAARNEAA